MSVVTVLCSSLETMSSGVHRLFVYLVHRCLTPAKTDGLIHHPRSLVEVPLAQAILGIPKALLICGSRGD